MEKVLLDKAKLLENLDKKEVIEEIEVPELMGKYGLPGDKVPYLKIRGASLQDHINCQNVHKLAAFKATQFLQFKPDKKFDMQGFIDSVNNPDDGKFLFELNLFKDNVIDPEFKYNEVLEISTKCPEVINRVVKRILGITSLEN